MADMAGLDQSEQGVVATVLLASYLVTPLMAFSVSGIITVIVSKVLDSAPQSGVMLTPLSITEQAVSLALYSIPAHHNHQ
jgi:hypothetical protein